MILKVIAFLALLHSSSHDFHVSILNGERNPASGKLEMSLKVFSNDLEDALRLDEGVETELDPQNRELLPDAALASYLKKHIGLKAEGKILKLEYVGQEKEQDITFIYLQVRDIPLTKSLEVKNSLFLNHFQDQSNIVNIEMAGELRSVFLESSSPVKTINYSF